MKNSYFIAFMATGLLCLGPAYGQARKVERVLGRYTVRSIEFNFIGKRTYKHKRLLGKLGFRKDEAIDAALAEFGREDLEEFYLRRGFAFVRVALDYRRLPEGDVIYTIEEGPRVKIKTVTLTGNKAVKTNTLKKAIKVVKKKWVFWPRYYNEEELNADADRLEDAYWERGFLDYRVTAKKEFTDDKSKVRIAFEILEGPVYTVGKIILSGAQKIYDIDINGHFTEEAVLAQLKLEPGQIYRKRQADSDRKQLLKIYRECGFINAAVALYVDKLSADEGAQSEGEFASEGIVNVEFKITEGEPFRIGRIDVIGNKQTQDKVIRRVLDSYGFQPGQRYNADIARGDGSGELEIEIRRDVYTEEATITALTGYEIGQKNVEVYVEEGQTGQWILNAGISSDSGVMGGLIWEQRNFDINDWPESLDEFLSIFWSDLGPRAFTGAGQSLRIALMPGTELSQYTISFREPYFQDRPVWLDVIGLDNEWERESYEEGRTKGYVGFGERYERRYRDRWRKSIGFRVENVDIDGIDFDAPKEIKDVKGDNALVGVKVDVDKDLTDDRIMPTEGQHLNGSYEQVAGEHTFGILSGTYRWYKTIYEDLAGQRTILATRLRAATVLGDAPPFEKFYGGGMYTIRGFEYRGVSTRGTPEVGGVPVAGAEDKDPIGSDWIFLANAEVTVPLVSEDLAALFFIDSGAIDSGNYRAAVGAGIQILIPQWFGRVPMRIGVAAPFLKDDSDDTEAFFFSVGRLF